MVDMPLTHMTKLVDMPLTHMTKPVANEVDTSHIADDAAAAADLLEAEGWCQGNYVDGDAHCLVGALPDVVARDLTAQGVTDAAALIAAEIDRSQAVTAAVAEYLGLHTASGVTSWNDDPARTADEVVGVLRDVAIKHRRDETSGA